MRSFLFQTWLQIAKLLVVALWNHKQRVVCVTVFEIGVDLLIWAKVFLSIMLIDALIDNVN